MSITEVVQVLVPCIAVPVLVGVLLLVVHLCRRRHTSAAAAGLPSKATRRQHGTPPVVTNTAVGTYTRSYLYTMAVLGTSACLSVGGDCARRVRRLWRGPTSTTSTSISALAVQISQGLAVS